MKLSRTQKNSTNKIFEKGSITFYNSSQFFFGQVRDDIFTLYAFVRTVDDFVDQLPQDSDSFFDFKKNYKKALLGQRVDNIIISSFVELMRRKHFLTFWVDAFLGAMEADLNKASYETEKEIQEYIFGSAVVIGLMMARIMDLPCESYKYARSLGIAYQYINFIRDIKEDMALKRNYFPRADQKKFGLNKYTADYLINNPTKFNKFVHFQLKKYRRYLQKGLEGFKYIPRKYQASIQTANDMYNWTADVISENPLIVLDKPVKPTKSQVLFSGFKNLLFT